MNPIVSIVVKLGQISECKNLDDVIAEIRDGKYKLKVEEVRKLQNSGKGDDANLLKKTLPSFITAGKFVGGHKKENLSLFSGVLILDFDGITTQSYDFKFAKACSVPTTLCAFRSPRGNGLKIVVPFSAGEKYFECSFMQVAEYYSEQLGIPYDISGKNISRLCFFSYDPNLYRNLECEVFQIAPCPEVIEVENKILEVLVPDLTMDEVEINFNKAELHTKRIITFKDGFRNNFVFCLAYNCCKLNIPLIDAQNLILSKYKYDKNEVKSTISSAYQNEKGNSKKANIQKESLFSINLLNFKKYKSNILIEERIMFETLLIKMLSFNGNFYFTMKMVEQEIGIKRNKAQRIFKWFIEIGFISIKKISYQSEGEPRQKNIFEVIPENIVETSKLMFIDNKEFVMRISPLLVGYIDSKLKNQ